ncbi:MULTISPECIES: helix-turn-helix domain-containing protein [unclassified Sporosarcina]|uniref:helix-turn-helix domain-containing protein n=1 Tax=unclassified Sporosarcina TaxID=2647733 RepID=UPI001A937661|nr:MULTISPECIES: helix-turn-helix domain-containing protein [unclassified Sporosarcina]MBO0587598.1 helix-turn-helix domain-containing protein [Sporosarcina sp. E16_8]MBO0602414.1 helix-turn-helix domain-containing protein [Sporosarcina sp. E16_3]
MNAWYTRQEVADILAVSKPTVYHYAKQKKIIKIADPHRLTREARYQKEEVDALAEERSRNKPTGLRPSELAKRLGVSVTRIYTIIRDNYLPVDEILLGDEGKGYSISEEMAVRIQEEVVRTMPVRGTRVEFYDSKHDISLYQRFLAPNGQDMRVLRNDNLEWGFFLQSRTWIPYREAINKFKYEAAYPIHQSNRRAAAYTDFVLPKDLVESFDFLDFVYQVWGIENIRLRERETDIALSIKSGLTVLPIPVPETITECLITSFLALGNVELMDGECNLISGYRRNTVDLPNTIWETLHDISKQQDKTISEYIEDVLRENFEREQN